MSKLGNIKWYLAWLEDLPKDKRADVVGKLMRNLPDHNLCNALYNEYRANEITKKEVTHDYHSNS